MDWFLGMSIIINSLRNLYKSKDKLHYAKIKEWGTFILRMILQKLISSNMSLVSKKNNQKLWLTYLWIRSKKAPILSLF